MSKTAAAPKRPPSFKSIRRYLPTIQQREALGVLIRAGWSPAELAEYARSAYLAPGETKPTAASYQFVIEKGVNHECAKEALATMRAPGFVMPPYDRPVSRENAWEDDPHSPKHLPEVRADIAEMVRCWRNREATKHGQPWPEDGGQGISRGLWKWLYRVRNRYCSLGEALQALGLSAYGTHV